MSRTINISVICASKEKSLYQRLQTSLALLRRNRLVAISQNDNFDSADIIFVLISPDLVASERWSLALTLLEERTPHVIPILARPVDDLGAFSGIEPLPQNRKPITKWGNRDEAFASIASGVRKLVDQYD